MLKAVLSDFDGTIVTKDILDVACGIVGKEEESRRLNEEFQQGLREGLPSLVERINFLQGVNFNQIKEKLRKEPYLMPGAEKWFNFLKENGIRTILYSGNIEPILAYYKELLNIDYIVGTKPKMEGDKILGITQDDFPEYNWKIVGIEKILKEEGISREDCIAIGDSRADKRVFEYVGRGIAFNSKDDELKKIATYNIEGDLNQVVSLVKNELKAGLEQVHKEKRELL